MRLMQNTLTLVAATMALSALGLTVDQVSDLDLAYTPPLGSPWDAVQTATQAWSQSRTISSLAARRVRTAATPG